MTPLTYHLLFDCTSATIMVSVMGLLTSFVAAAAVSERTIPKPLQWLLWAFGLAFSTSVVVFILLTTFIGHPDFLQERWNNTYHLVHPAPP